MKKHLAPFLMLAALAAPLTAAPAESRGSLVICGGNLVSALDRIHRRFIELGGGAENIRLAIIAAGSDRPAVSGRENAADFIRLGVPAERIRVFPVAALDDPTTPDVDESKWRGNGAREDLAQEMLNYTAVFFGGGDQIRYNQTLKRANGEDLPLLASIREVYARGGVIGGSSAGAAMMCDPMICDGFSMNALSAGAAYRPDSCPDPKGVSLANGLGFFTAGMVDQHFLKRGRIGRLLIALYAIPKLRLGFGIDEDTAAVCQGGTIEVLGSSGVVIVDATAAKEGKNLSWSTADGLRAKGFLLHYLEEGDRFDAASRTPLPRPERLPIEAGRQEYADFPLETNLFGRDSFRDMMINGIAENRKGEAAGIAFALDGQGRGTGSQWTLRKTERTATLYASIGDADTYSITYVSLDIQPISLRVKKK